MTEAQKVYRLAHEVASKVLPPTHPARLRVAVSFSQFYSDVMKEPEKAHNLAKEVRTYSCH